MKIKTRSQVHCTEEKELVSDPYKFDFTVIGLNPIITQLISEPDGGVILFITPLFS